MYIGFTSHNGYRPQYGWLFGYDMRTLEQIQSFVSTPADLQSRYLCITEASTRKLARTGICLQPVVLEISVKQYVNWLVSDQRPSDSTGGGSDRFQRIPLQSKAITLKSFNYAGATLFLSTTPQVFTAFNLS